MLPYIKTPIGYYALIFLGILLVLGVPQDNNAKNSKSQDDKGIRVEITPVTFNECEFVVNFPTATKQKQIYSSGIELVRVGSVYKKDNPYLRAECVHLKEEDKNNIIKVIIS